MTRELTLIMAKAKIHKTDMHKELANARSWKYKFAYKFSKKN